MNLQDARHYQRHSQAMVKRWLQDLQPELKQPHTGSCRSVVQRVHHATAGTCLCKMRTCTQHSSKLQRHAIQALHDTWRAGQDKICKGPVDEPGNRASPVGRPQSLGGGMRQGGMEAGDEPRDVGGGARRGEANAENGRAGVADPSMEDMIYSVQQCEMLRWRWIA